jgi:transposase-like protein
MSKSALSAPHFHDEAAAYAYVEARIWKDGRVCPHCGVLDQSGPLKGKSNRIGLYKCYACRSPFNVKVGTIFEGSHIPMTSWLMAIHLVCSSKKGISANQLHRTLGITLKSAWFLGHRIREAMRPSYEQPLGGEGKIVEADATYVGGKEKNKHVHKRDPKNIGGKGKQIVHTLVERGGSVRSQHVPDISGRTLKPILTGQIDPKTSLMTDTAGGYMNLGKGFARHEMVDHGADEYVRGDAHSNTVEGYFSIFKRGMTGVYQHCSPRHLHRYLSEFDFRYSNREAVGVSDIPRTMRAIEGVVGKRLKYRSFQQRA